MGCKARPTRLLGTDGTQIAPQRAFWPLAQGLTSLEHLPTAPRGGLFFVITLLLLKTNAPE